MPLTFNRRRRAARRSTRGCLAGECLRRLLISPPSRRKRISPPTRQRLAVCLTEGRSTRLHLIEDLYCGDGISVAPKGTRAWDFTTEKPVTYWTDGVQTICYEKASGTYLFRN